MNFQYRPFLHFLFENRKGMLTVGLAALFSILFFVPHFLSPYPGREPDTWYYLSGALNIALGRGYVDYGWETITLRGPVVPLVMGLSYWLTESYTAQQGMVAYLVMNCLGIISLILIGEKYLFRGAGFLAFGLLLSNKFIQGYAFVRLLTDLPQALFLLHFWLASYLAVKKQQLRFWALAGVCLGFAFLTKESALLWLPFPIVLHLLHASHLSSKLARSVVAFLASFFVSILPWYLYVYFTTGEIFLAGRLTDQLAVVNGLLSRYALVTAGLIVLLVGIALSFYFFRIQIAYFLNSLFHQVITLRIAAIAILLVYLGITFTPVSFSALSTYAFDRLLPIFPWPFAIAAWGFLIFKAYRKPDVLLTSLFLVMVFTVPTYLIVARWNVQERNLLFVMVISVLVVSYVLLQVTAGLLNRWKLSVYGLSLLVCVLLFLYAHAFQLNLQLVKDARQLPMVGQHPVAVSSWLDQYGVPSETILSTWLNEGKIFVATKGKYRLSPLYSEDTGTWASVSLPDPNTLFSNTFGMPGEKPAVISLADPDPGRKNHLIILYPSMIADRLKALDTDYVLVTGNHRRSPMGLSYYLSCLPTTQILTQSQSANDQGAVLFKIDSRWSDLLSGCPTVIDPASLEYVFQTAATKPGYQNEYQVLRLLGEDIQIFGNTPMEAINTYLRLAAIYAASQDDFRAWSSLSRAASINSQVVFETTAENPNAYSTALDILRLDDRFRVSTDAQAKKELYEALLLKYPDRPLVYYAYGKYLSDLMETQRAVDMLEKAVAMDPAVRDYRLALGQAFAMQNDYDQALSMIDPILAQDPRSAPVYFLRQTIEASRLASIGNTTAAVKIRNSLSQEEADNVVEPIENKDVFFNFLSDVAPASQRSSGEAVVRDVFVGRTSLEVLYMHPPASQAFEIKLPKNAMLEFTPALSPNVWRFGLGDGVTFQIILKTASGEHKIFDRYLDPKNIARHRRWTNEKIDLSFWAGQKVTLTFKTEPGPSNNSNFDWAGWGQPRLMVPITYDFLENLASLPPGAFDSKLVRPDGMVIQDEDRNVLFEHPSSQVKFTVDMPDLPLLKFGIGMDPATWAEQKTDGVAFHVYVVRADDPNTYYHVFSRYLDPSNRPEDRGWFDASVDLHEFANERVTVIFETLPGPRNDDAFDWAAWSRPVIIRGYPLIETDSAVGLQVEAP